MWRGFQRMSLRRQFLLWVLLVALSAVLMTMLLVGQAYIASAHSRARTIANLVEDVGTWASQYREGMWVRSDETRLAKVGDFLDAVGEFHRKNPALVQRELSDVTQRSRHSATFRITSDRFMNPNNAPNRFELAAIENSRETGQSEMVEIKGNQLLYARRLTVKPGCMSCHDTPEKAPEVVRVKYPTRGYGYKLGGVAGVISVSLPIIDDDGGLLQTSGASTWLGMGGFGLSLLALLWFISRSVIAPIQRLSAHAVSASEADISALKDMNWEITEGEEGSRNEVDRLGVATKRLLRSLKLQRKY